MSARNQASGVMGSVLGLVAAWVRRRHIEQELSHLDDRLLSDIGVSRGEISSIARRCAAAQAPMRDYAANQAGAPVTVGQRHAA